MAPRAHNLSAPEAPNHRRITDPSNDEMDSSWMAVRHRCAKLSLRSQLKPFQKESVNALYDRCC
jgi:hypothetical protein